MRNLEKVVNQTKKPRRLNTPDERASKKSYIKETLEYIKENASLCSFAELYLDSLSLRRLQTFTHNELADFVTERFNFTMEALEKDGDFRLQEIGSNRNYFVEISSPHASQLIITIERLLHSRKARVYFKIHPELAVSPNTDNSEITFEGPNNKNSRVATSYFEFDGGDLEISIDDLREELAHHILAVKLAHRDSSKMKQMMLDLKLRILENNIKLDIPKEEWADLIDWLLDRNFTVLGYVSFPDETSANDVCLSGLGILSGDFMKIDNSHLYETLLAHTWKTSSASSSIIFDNIRAKSPVQRKDNLMRLALKVPNENGEMEHQVFLGLLKRSSGLAKNWLTPVIHLKMKEIFETMSLTPGSYNYNEVARIFSTMPKFELFRTPTAMLQNMVDDLMSITDPNEIHCFAQEDTLYDRMQMVVYVPSEIYSPKIKKLIFEILKKEAPLIGSEIFEVRDAIAYRIHVYFELATKTEWNPDLHELERSISEMLKPWEEKVVDLVGTSKSFGVEKGVCQTLIPMFPAHYRSRTSPEETIQDIFFLEKLTKTSQIQYNLQLFEMPGSYLHKKASLLHVYSRDKIDLIDIMPILQNMDLHVLDQLTTRIGRKENTLGYIQSFRVRNSRGDCINLKKYKTKLGDILQSIYGGKIENDPLNSLVLIANIGWREISVLKLYRNLFLQTKAKFTKSKINESLKTYPNQTLLLVKYFRSKFSPKQEFGDKEYRVNKLLPSIKKEFIEALRGVDEVAADVIFRRLFDLVECTLRTNFYIPKEDESTFISVKIDSQKVTAMPVPAPFVEIYVHDVGLEGTHLRFGPVARGGLRWSDRPDDFRTEILGLVKTQQTKNVVIVPVGSKGGFTVKNLPEAREEALNRVQCEYKRFISALLDITDNLDKDGKPVHPAFMIPYDNLDPYLVVAADKGTATFSDLANAISLEYGFWLGDAFASGGSNGYDHKKVGITARGGWECVKLHFHEMGKDIQTDETTVVGIGDMSGDVFGNGMLQSKALKLRAAFNHIHIFLDPDPDPSVSWEERDRLFKLPRSTWRDYNLAKISKGGGIFDRKTKEIPLTSQIREMLGTDETTMSGEDLVRSILKMETDLMWFGGIGTYIKADSETNLVVGDQANDDIRINASECKALVIGEGANLGMTQTARRQLNMSGKRLNTDAIDNSAGVNMSDYEVNIKILLQRLLNEELIKDEKERNKILEAATEEVSALVLANNRRQHRLISMDHIRSKSNFKSFRDLITELIENRGLNGKSEGVPTVNELKAQEAKNIGLSRPVIAVLQAYVKMWVYNELIESKMLDHTYLEATYRNYFPKSIQERFKHHITQHPLKREIIGTQLTNKIINQAGINFFFDLLKETGRTIEEIATCYFLIDEALNGPSIRKRLNWAKTIPVEDRYLALITLEDKIKNSVRFMLKRPSLPTLDDMDKFKSLFDDIREASSSGTWSPDVTLPWQSWDIPENDIHELNLIQVLEYLPDVFLIRSQQPSVNVIDGLNIVCTIKDKFEFDFLERMILSLDVHDKWELEHRKILLEHFGHHKSHLMDIMAEKIPDAGLDQDMIANLIKYLEERFGPQMKEYISSIQGLQESSEINATNLTVVIEKLNFLEQSTH